MSLGLRPRAKGEEVTKQETPMSESAGRPQEPSFQEWWDSCGYALEGFKPARAAWNKIAEFYRGRPIMLPPSPAGPDALAEEIHSWPAELTDLIAVRIMDYLRVGNLAMTASEAAKVATQYYRSRPADRDAERYRWLRQARLPAELIVVQRGYGLWAKALDDAIDAAMSQQEGKAKYEAKP
jgi:hypothetical protein